MPVAVWVVSLECLDAHIVDAPSAVPCVPCVYSSLSPHDSTRQNVAFEINTVMTMLTHELAKGQRVGSVCIEDEGIWQIPSPAVHFSPRIVLQH